MDSTNATRAQLLNALRTAKMALTLAEHQADQVTTHPQPTSNLDFARESADQAVVDARRVCHEIRAQIGRL